MLNKRTIVIAAVTLLSAAAFFIYELTAGPLGTSRRLEQLDTNLAKWQAQGITHYQMDVSIRCFCPFGERMPVTVEVLNGVIVSLVDNAGQSVGADDALRKSENIRLMTVDGLFESARKAIEKADSAAVRYDETMGYPLSLSIDWWAGTGDDNEGAEVIVFRALP